MSHARHASKRSTRRYAGSPKTHDGPDIAALEAALAKHVPKLFYALPDFRDRPVLQEPTLFEPAPSRTLHMSSFTTLIAKGVRMGFMLGEAELLEKIVLQIERLKKGRKVRRRSARVRRDSPLRLHRRREILLTRSWRQYPCLHEEVLHAHERSDACLFVNERRHETRGRRHSGVRRRSREAVLRRARLEARRRLRLG